MKIGFFQIILSLLIWVLPNESYGQNKYNGHYYQCCMHPHGDWAYLELNKGAYRYYADHPGFMSYVQIDTGSYNVINDTLYFKSLKYDDSFLLKNNLTTISIGDYSQIKDGYLSKDSLEIELTSDFDRNFEIPLQEYQLRILELRDNLLDSVLLDSVLSFENSKSKVIRVLKQTDRDYVIEIRGKYTREDIIIQDSSQNYCEVYVGYDHKIHEAFIPAFKDYNITKNSSWDSFYLSNNKFVLYKKGLDNELNEEKYNDAVARNYFLKKIAKKDIPKIGK